MTNNTFNVATFALFIIASFAAGLGGSWFTGSLTAHGFIAPMFAPPSWIFAPVWSALYAMMGASAYFLMMAPKNNWKPLAMALFSLQLVLNALWTPIFFGAGDLIGSMYIIIALLLTITAYTTITYPISKAASWLFVPYVKWVAFATILNYGYVALNT